MLLSTAADTDTDGVIYLSIYLSTRKREAKDT